MSAAGMYVDICVHPEAQDQLKADDERAGQRRKLVELATARRHTQRRRKRNQPGLKHRSQRRELGYWSQMPMNEWRRS